MLIVHNRFSRRRYGPAGRHGRVSGRHDYLSNLLSRRAFGVANMRRKMGHPNGSIEYFGCGFHVPVALARLQSRRPNQRSSCQCRVLWPRFAEHRLDS